MNNFSNTPPIIAFNNFKMYIIGDSIKIEEHAIEKPPQVDGGAVTPPNEQNMDIEELNKLGLFFSQLDGADSDNEEESSSKETNEEQASKDKAPAQEDSTNKEAESETPDDTESATGTTNVKKEPMIVPEADKDDETTEKTNVKVSIFAPESFSLKILGLNTWKFIQNIYSVEFRIFPLS